MCQYRFQIQLDGAKPVDVGALDACKRTQLNVTAETARDPKPIPSTLHPIIINRSPHNLTAMHISSKATTDWGGDLLGRATIAPRGEAKLDVPANGTCLFDVKAEYDVGDPQEMGSLDLCLRRTVTFNGRVPGEPVSTGTGFRIDGAGHIMTNNHVVEGCGSMSLRSGDQWVPLRVVGADPKLDIAVLQQPDVVTDFLSFRSLTTPVKVAERAIAIGFPVPEQLGDRAVTEGIVNSLSGVRGMHTRYQLQTPIQPGNSGGPILDRYGLVIGVAVSRLELVSDRAMQDVNFAIKPSVAAKFAESLGVQLRYEQGGKDLSTADVMERDGDRVALLLCRY